MKSKHKDPETEPTKPAAEPVVQDVESQELHAKPDKPEGEKPYSSELGEHSSDLGKP